MAPERWERVKLLYHSALERNPEERGAFLQEACRDDGELRSEVESLLAQASGDSFLERPAWEGIDSADSESESVDAGNAPRRQHPFRCSVWTTLAGLVALFGYAAWRMPQDVPALGWQGARRGAVVRVASVNSAGPAAGKLQPGDRLLSLDGDANVGRVGAGPYVRSLDIGDRYRIQVSRSGTIKEFVLQVSGASPNLRFRLSYFLIALAWCAVALFIGFARPQDALARLAFGAATLTGLVFLTVGDLPGVYVLQPLHGVLGYHFFYRFPDRTPRGRAWRVLLWLLYAGASVSVAFTLRLLWLGHFMGPRAATAWLASPLTWRLPGVFGAAMLGAVAVAIHRYRALTDQDQRRRFHWVALGGAVGLAPAALWGVIGILGGLRGAPLMSQQAWGLFSLGVNAGSVAVPLSVAYAVVKHRVFDVRVAIRRGIQYLLAKRALQFLLALPSAALLCTLVKYRHHTIADLVAGTTGYLYWMLALGLSLKFRAHISRWLDRKFFREQYDGEQIVLSLVDDLARFDSVDEMTSFVSTQLERSLHPKSMHLWWREGARLRLAHSSDPALAGEPCPVSRSVLERLGTVGNVPIAAETGISGIESRWLEKTAVRLIVPLVGAERLEGVLMLGEKQSEEPYSAGDARLLHAVARQAAVIRDNLRLKAQVVNEQRVRHEVLAKLDSDLIDLLRECPACGACFDSSARTCDRDGNLLTLTLPVSRTIGDKYRLEQLIGRGGMGAVYEARDLGLGRQVAIKIMLGGDFGHETALRRFRREARAVALLNHPNIVSLYDFGELEGGGAYIVMERLRGATLRAEMSRVGAFSPVETAEWFEQVLAGLAGAHKRGVVHRDLKPENIVGVRDSSGSLTVKILDFGLAKSRALVATASASQSLTESGVMLGTLAYMAPEQLSGREADPRADLYAAGVVLVEMLTGRRPFEDGPGMNADYRLPPAFPNQATLESVLQRCLAKAPESRFSSASELSGALIPALRACKLIE